MFKRLLFTLALMSMIAGTTFAAGLNLSTGACPGDAAASASAGTLDCARGTSVDVYLTVEMAEATTHFVGLDAILDIVVSGDVTSSATFWDFANVNSAGWPVSKTPPASGCADYANFWSVPSGDVTAAAAVRNADDVRLAVAAFRATDATVAANQKVFGFTMTVKTANAVEAGGALTGCGSEVCLIAHQVIPQSAAGEALTTLQLSTEFGQVVSFNNGSLSPCLATPTVRHTWGQLKSLYR